MTDDTRTTTGRKIPFDSEREDWYCVRGKGCIEPVAAFASRVDAEAWAALNRPFIGAVVYAVRAILFPR